LEHPQIFLVFSPWYLHPLGTTNNNYDDDDDDDDIKTEAVLRLCKSYGLGLYPLKDSFYLWSDERSPHQG
jgi:hypothetical protein